MDNFNQTDLNKRLERLHCCIGNLGDKVRKDFLYGLKCTKQDLKNLKLLIAYYKSVCNYIPIDATGTVASGTVTMSGANGSIRINVAGIPVSAAIDFSSSVSATAALVATSINNYTNVRVGLTATQTPGTGKLTIVTDEVTADLNDAPITATVTGDMAISGVASTLVMAGGEDLVADGDNGITEAEMQNIFERASNICDTCFKTAGYSYS